MCWPWKEGNTFTLAPQAIRISFVIYSVSIFEIRILLFCMLGHVSV